MPFSWTFLHQQSTNERNSSAIQRPKWRPSYPSYHNDPPIKPHLPSIKAIHDTIDDNDCDNAKDNEVLDFNDDELNLKSLQVTSKWDEKDMPSS